MNLTNYIKSVCNSTATTEVLEEEGVGVNMWIKDTNIMICIPNQGDIRYETTASLLNMYKPCNVYYSFVCGSLVYDARNDACIQMMNDKSMDYLMFIDSDIVFPRKALESLLSLEADISTGIYYGKEQPYKPILVDDLANNKFYNVIPDEESFNVEACGMGFCLISRRVIESIYKKFGAVWFTPANNMGEDFSFCSRARDLGYNIVADNMFNLGHIKTNMCISKETISK